MQEEEIKRILEACLISSTHPLSTEQLQGVFEVENKPALACIQRLLADLATDYLPLAFELVEVATGYILQTKAVYGSWVARLQVEKPSKYSRALLETLAIIAYKQPVTRAYIEDIRGVAVSTNVMKTLLEREWIRVAGYKDLPGKPAVYVTTPHFLNYFNLRSLDELPPIMDVFQHE